MKEKISQEYAAVRHKNMNRHKAAVLKFNRWLQIAATTIPGIPLYKVRTYRKFYRQRHKCVYLQNQETGEVITDRAAAATLHHVLGYMESELKFNCDELVI